MVTEIPGTVRKLFQQSDNWNRTWGPFDSDERSQGASAEVHLEAAVLLQVPSAWPAASARPVLLVTGLAVAAASVGLHRFRLSRQPEFSLEDIDTMHP